MGRLDGIHKGGMKLRVAFGMKKDKIALLDFSHPISAKIFQNGEVAEGVRQGNSLDLEFIVDTILSMRIEYDPEKSIDNEKVRGISFDLAERFEWETAFVVRDERRDYGDDRFLALGLIDGRVHSLVFTPRSGAIRVISLRKANKREIRAYESKSRIDR